MLERLLNLLTKLVAKLRETASRPTGVYYTSVPLWRPGEILIVFS
jgi:hypothetical protein